MTKLSRLFLAGSFVLAAGAAHAMPVYDASAQFDLDNNPSAEGGWSYGSINGLSGAFTLLPIASTPFTGLSGWTYSPSNQYPNVLKNVTVLDISQPGGGFFPAGGLTLSDGAISTEGILAVLRWTTPTSGVYDVSAVFTGVWDHSGALGDVYVLKDGMQLFSGTIDKRETTDYFGTLTLLAGQNIDFAVSSSPDNLYFRSVLDAQISQISMVPEPSVYTLLLLGLGVLTTLRRLQGDA